MAIVNLPSGATVTTYPAPPAGFEPLLADNESLARFGLPRRPVEHPERLARWQRLIGTPSHFIEPTFRRVPNKRHGPRRRGIAEATETSDNWSGAVVFAPPGTSCSSVAGQWNVPTPNPESDDSIRYYSSFWIGIDGDGSNDVFQAGVECEAANSGGGVERTVYAWWEWFPENEVQITNFPVLPGQVLACLLTVVSNTSGNIFLKNLTTGAATSFTISAPTGTTLIGNSAEWVAERPGIGGAISKLANYGEVDFTHSAAHTSAGAILQPVSGDNMNMVDGGQIISTGVVQPPDTVRCIYTGPIEGPYQTRIFERATTFANENDGTWLMADYDRDGIPDLIFIKTSNTPNGHVEVHVASAASQYQTRIFERATTFANENDGTWLMADYDRDGIPDLVFIKTNNTPNGHVEVHVASGASQYQTRIFERATTFANENDGTWLVSDYDRDGVPDLVFIKTSNTPNGHVEVHVASGASQYQTRIFERATTFANENDGTWLMADFDRDGIPDLVFIKTNNTPNGHVEVHIASGASQYQTRIFEAATTFVNENDGTWLLADVDRDGIPDLIFVKTNNTPNGHVEVHVARGRA